MPVLLVEDYEMADSALAAILMRGGYAVLGPAAGLEEAVGLLADRNARLALIRMSSAFPLGTIAIARELRRLNGLACLLVGGKRDVARSGRDAAIGHMCLPSTGDTLLWAVGAAITIAGGRIPVDVPDGLELF
ncbi:hypothetical protein [Sphingomonas oryzagri]